MVKLTVSLLGSLHITLDGVPVTDFATDKARALLAYLIVEADRPHRRDVLSGLLWPEEPERRARQNLRQALSYLRRAIGDQDEPVPFLLITRQTLQFNRTSDHWVDVVTFTALVEACERHRHRRLERCLSCMRRLEQMVALYRGEFLAQFFLSDSGAFEEWASLKREWLHREAIEALYHLTCYYERRGDLVHAQRYAWRQVELEPWREEAHRQLMRLLALDGQRSAALAQYEACSQALTEDLHVKPTEETQALYESIRARRPTALRFRSPASLHNLPPAPTPFVGREADRAELAELLTNPDCRLVTVVGPGGIGKTRLALQVAAEHVGIFADGVVFVPLAPISSPALLTSTIADALDFSFHQRHNPKEQLLNYLGEKEMLLVLDSMEHLLKGNTLLAEMLRYAPGLVLLVTSRERLSLREEWGYTVEGLEMDSAVDLFRQRARQANRRFSLSEPEKPNVVRICQLVEKMPLGVELAAAWVVRRTCGEIAREIERGLDILTTSLRNVPARQRSVRATFEHSWNLLSEQERQVFRRLSVFRGGFEQEAAEQVASASLSILSALVDRSLLRRTSTGRYQVHALLRQYAAEKLRQTPEAQERIEALHSHYYAAFLHERESALRGKDQPEALDAIRAEIDNVRRAWHWAFTQLESGRDEPSVLAVLQQSVESLYLFYTIRGWYQEGEEMLGRAATKLDTGTPIGEGGLLLGKLLARQGKCCEFTEHSDKAGRLFEKSLMVFRRLDTRRETALPLYGLGYIAHMRGEYAQAEQYLQESLAVYREQGDRWGVANVLSNLCLVARRQGAFAEAKRRGEESLTIRREIGDRRGVASSLNNLGLVHCALGDYAEARKLLQESLQICRQLGHKVGVANVCAGLCQVNFQLEDVEAAERFGQEGLTLCQDIGDRWGEAIALNNLGSIAAETGHHARAKRLFQESILVYRQIEIKSGLANVLSNLGEAYYNLGLYGEAKHTLYEALEIAHEIRTMPIILEILIRLAPLLAQEGQVTRGLEWLAFAAQHPATLEESRDKANRRLSELAANLSPKAMATAKRRSQTWDLNTVVMEILRDEWQSKR